MPNKQYGDSSSSDSVRAIGTGSNSIPFFVVGVQRSGTTMLRLMLDSHPEVAIPFESGFITVFYSKLDEYGNLKEADNLRNLLNDICQYHKVQQGDLISDPEKIMQFDITDYRGLVDTIMTEYATRQGKQRWGDKTPFYITDIDILYRVFPECRVIHLVRDGRDVAVSQQRVSWTSNNIMRIAEDWSWKVTIARKIGNVLGSQYKEVHYEDLILRTESTLREICDFIGLSFDSGMLEYHQRGSARMPAKSMEWHKTSVQPPDNSKVGAWRSTLSTTDRILFEDIAEDALTMMGYAVERPAKTPMSRLKSLYYSVLKRW